MDIMVGSNITLLNKNNNIEYEMACFDIVNIHNENIYYFQSVDKNGNMEVIKIPENILNLLNWQESPISRFIRFDKISDILENYHNLNQLDLKGFSGYYDKKTNLVNSVSLYLSNNNFYIEIICFGCLYPYTINHNHYFSSKKENIPFIYVKESNKISELHLNQENKLFYLSTYNLYKMNDISCWSGKEYLDKLVFPIEKFSLTTPEIIQKSITLEGYGVEFKPNISSANYSYTDNMILIFDHKSKDCLKFYDNGILIDTSWYEKTDIFTFIKNIKT